MKNGTTKVSKKKLQSYCGNYKTESGGFRKILLEGKQLFSQRGEGDKLMIFPETETRFFYGFNTDIKIEFLKNEKEEVVGTKNSNEERSETAEKVNYFFKKIEATKTRYSIYSTIYIKIIKYYKTLLNSKM